MNVEALAAEPSHLTPYLRHPGPGDLRGVHHVHHDERQHVHRDERGGRPNSSAVHLPKNILTIPGVQRFGGIMVLLTLLAAEVALAEATAGPSWTHTRPLSVGAIALLANAAEHSSIVTTLLKELEQTDIVVYLTDAMPWAAKGSASYMVFLSRDATTRYLLVRIDRWRVSVPERIALLGHELQHALEVAAAPDVNDADGLAQLYRRIGWEAQKNRFETAGAKAVSNRVRKQLAERNQ